MSNSRMTIVAGLIVVLCAAGGCSSTRIASQWKNNELAAAKYKRFLVIGVSVDPGLRQLFEDEFSKALASRGVSGIPSYQHLPEGKPTREAVEQLARSSGADAVLISRVVQRSSESHLETGPPSFGPMEGYYESAWNGSYEPPTVSTVMIVRIETRLFDAATGKLAWSAETETFDPQDLPKEIKSFSGVVIKAIAKNGLI